ncbi:amidohydrolase family protein [Streptomyces sp. NBC_01264]|uniref:amidohydrolase family protein n=1 Tax=Streptomyces sp. NBC_01264 TaxID=2903804 RepID=UPI0022591EDB|nr:amidohydrolase family protein [Streptomyces sp. NBC_01264]MCX4778050.1 amidohydrolase [Streptomyces sp. NBC_01264]
MPDIADITPLQPDDGSHDRIDVHHHFCAPEWLEWAEGQGLANRKALPPWARWDAAAALDLMDRAGIATAVLKPMLPARYATSAQLREATAVTLRAAAEVTRAHPGRFAFHAPLFLDDPEVARWALRLGLDELGAVGVNVTANYGGVYLGDPSYDPLFAELDERSAVVDTHPHNLPGVGGGGGGGGMAPAGGPGPDAGPGAGHGSGGGPGAGLRTGADAGPGAGRGPGAGGGPGGVAVPGIPHFLCDFLLDTTRAALNMIHKGTLDRFPNLSVILPHAGGFLPHIATRVQAFAGSLTPPVDPAMVRDYLLRFYYDTAGPMSPAGTLLAMASPDRILFGSDWPACPSDMVTGIALPGLADDPALTPAHRRGINRDNAVRLMPSLAPLSPARV